MEKLTMDAQVRLAESTPKILKKDGKIPAVVYGKETKSMPIEIRVKDIEKTVKTLAEGTLLITLTLTDHDKKEEKTVIIKEIMRNPVTDEIVHADFHQISEKSVTKFKVPVFTTGSPEGVKSGGVMQHIIRKISVKCLPKDLPAKYEIDVTSLKINDEMKIGMLPAISGVEILDNPKLSIVVVKGVKVEAVPVPGAAVEAAKEPEVIKGAPKPEEAAAADTKGGKGAAAKGAPAAKPAGEKKKK
jgi:large subunit ribosomal protein L25